METNHNVLRLVKLRVLAKEHGLQGYYRLKRAELIALLTAASWDDDDEPTPMPMPVSSVSVNPRLRSLARPPPNPMRPPPPIPPHSVDSFTPSELKRAFRGAYCSFRIEGRSRTDLEKFLEKTKGSVVNLIARELRDLKSVKVQTTTLIRLKMENENIIEEIDKVFNSRMTEIYRGRDLGKIIEMFAHMKTQVKIPALANTRFVFDQVLFLDIKFP